LRWSPDEEKEVEKMSLRPFGRRGGFYDAHSEVNRLLDEMFGAFGRRPGGRRAHATEWAPSVDVLQKDGDLVVRVEMPGVKPEGVEVAAHNGVLSISGERKVDEEEERAGYYVRELRHGSFRRSMILPEGVDEEKIRARYQDGILEVTLEGAATARDPRRVQIEVAGGQQGATHVEVSEVAREEGATPTTETAKPDEGTQGAAPPGDVPPETTPPETRPQ
jgi:HSP20 family protein